MNTYVKVILSVVCTTMIILAFSGCKQQTSEQEHEAYEDLYEQWSAVFEDLSYIADEHAALQQLVVQLDQHWNEDQEQTKTFETTYGVEGTNIQLTGAYVNPDKWEMSGKINEEDTFEVERVSDGVMLKYDEHTESLDESVFTFTLPSEHIRLLNDMITEQGYDRAEWQLTENGWAVHIIGTLALLEEEIAPYFSSHLQGKNQAFASAQLKDYDIIYVLQITEQVNELDLASLTFGLQKNGEALEEVTFTF
ncbi:hypothetical protein [Caldalkalibacillus salinus]|uniref:hypothetical protein n=1 Tax=Caldalkalibacillus salinus TaxID=2803787 RepID=UPI0019244D93|nr:hypothetical protein [Caldalkalibacillus salinus]